ncbi:MAG: FG-GAP repeat protein, partial [Candidatus Omnitrophica bacterium]|nr:FG-GAP repeat protein [Candidatus Omnitrophota bacterium]
PFDNKDPLRVLPANFVVYHGSDQHEVHDKAVSENRSWRYLAPSSRILKMNSSNLRVYSTFADDMYDVPEEERYQGDMPSHSIGPAVLGDLNGDGYEDIVLSCAFYYVGGSGRFYYFSVLTRKSPNSILKDITGQVNKLLWGE